MKILLVQTSFLGDTVLSTPVIAAIKKLYPQSEVFVLVSTRSKDLIQGDPFLAGVLTWDKHESESGLLSLWRKAAELRAIGFDRAYVLHRSFRTGLLMLLSRIPYRVGFSDSKLPFAFHSKQKRPADQHEVKRNLAILSNEASSGDLDGDLRLFTRPISEASPSLRAFLDDASAYALLVPGSAWRTKMWHAQGYREAAVSLQNMGMRVAVAGTAQDRENNRTVAEIAGVADFTGVTSLKDLLILVRRASVVICNDSLALHIASAFKVPTVAIFCATSPERA